jgi:mRNA-degrading endonuclease toxin of MazEF toxin-antitoxin module
MTIATDSVIVIPVTSNYVEASDIRVYLPPGEGTGLRSPSWAMTEKISAAPKSKLGSVAVGSVPGPVMREIERAVLVATGIAAR